MKDKVTNWFSENIAILIVGAVLSWASWSNRQQLETIGLKQDKAILQSQADATEKYVTKGWFQNENSNMRAQLVVVSTTVADMKTDLAVIKNEVRQIPKN